MTGGTLYDIIHKKSAKYFFDNWRNARNKGTQQVGGSHMVSLAVQTAAVDVMIADDGGNPDCDLADGDHYQDYACPIDWAPDPLLPDRSETGGAHASNCVADYMKTSWRSLNNYYGWSYDNNVPPAFRRYVRNFSDYDYGATLYWFSAFDWESYKAEIDAGRPWSCWLIAMVTT